MSATLSNTTERQLVEAACDGDEEAFRCLVEPHRPGLELHCYRMLGSRHDAEDALQEALLRAWRGLSGFDGRSSLRAWLHRITTNVCLDALARRRNRVLVLDTGPREAAYGNRGGGLLGDPVRGDAGSDEAVGFDDGQAGPAARYEALENLELAFVAALEHLPARQRAVLILREALGFSAKEVSAALQMTVASVNSALQRARKATDERLPEKSEQATVRSLRNERVREIVQNLVDGFQRGDVDAIVSLLADDVSAAAALTAATEGAR